MVAHAVLATAQKQHTLAHTLQLGQAAQLLGLSYGRMHSLE